MPTPGPTRAPATGPSRANGPALAGLATLRFERDADRADRVIARGQSLSAGVSSQDVDVVAGSSAWKVRFVEAAPRARVATERELDGLTTTINARSPEGRVQRTYAAARCADVYDGVDAVVTGEGARLSCAFEVRPGADPGRIRLDLGAAVRPDSSGGVTVVRPDGMCAIRVSATQTVAGTTRYVPARLVADGGRVALDLGGYDAERSVAVAEILSFSTYLGGQSADTAPNEFAYAVAAGSDGAVYVAGATQSSTFPVAGPPVQTNSGGQQDAFVAKLDPNSGALLYSTYIGGTGDDQAYGIAVDTSGNAYVVGSTTSPNFPTVNPIDGTIGTFSDAFVLKLNPSGSALVYSTYLGGGSQSAGTDTAYAATVDGNGNLYVAGSTSSADFPVVNAYDDSINGSLDVFVAKINAAGTALVYSTFIGGTSSDEAFGIALDSSGRPVIVGETASANWPTVSPLQANFGGVSDPLVARLSASGSSLEFSTYFGGSALDDASSVTIDSAGAVYFTGHTGSTNFPTQLPTQANKAGGFDAYIAKFVPSGAAYTNAFSTYLGGTADDLGYGIVIDSSGRPVVAGATGSADFPVVQPLQGTFGGPNGTADVFVTRFTTTGTPAIEYSTFLGGSSTEDAFAAASGPNGVFVAGFTQSTNFPLAQPYDSTLGGVRDAFVARVSTPGIGTDTAGIYIGSTAAFFLKNANAGGAADLVFTYGPTGGGWVPISGDWNGDGVDTPGIYSPTTGTFFLKNSNAPGPADIAFQFGAGGAGYVPLAGDWNADGKDTIGFYIPTTGTFFLRNSNTPGPADLAFTFGAGGPAVPLVGDWNGDGTDTVGVYDPASGTFFLKNTNSPGPGDLAFGYGPANSTPLAGDWNGDGTDTVGVYVSGTAAWFLRNSNTPGPGEIVFTYGPSGATPLPGDWNGL